jgi:hypothetical protein
VWEEIRLYPQKGKTKATQAKRLAKFFYVIYLNVSAINLLISPPNKTNNAKIIIKKQFSNFFFIFFSITPQIRTAHTKKDLLKKKAYLCQNLFPAVPEKKLFQTAGFRY